MGKWMISIGLDMSVHYGCRQECSPFRGVDACVAKYHANIPVQMLEEHEDTDNWLFLITHSCLWKP